MRHVLLIAHLLAAILFIGPATIGSSLFPRYALDPADLGVARLLHRLSKAYGTCSLAVAAVGIALAVQGELFEKAWVSASIGLFVLAVVVLLAVVVPAQAKVLAGSGAGSGAGTGDGPVDGDGGTAGPVGRAGLIARCRAGGGIYALLWAVVLVLMVTKP